MVITITDKQLKPVLMDSKVKGLKDPYYQIDDQEQVIIAISPGQNGTEYNKTIGYFNNFPGVKVFQCLAGQGVLLMQRNDEIGEAKEFKVVTLGPGRQVEIPSLWATCLVNIGRNFLVVTENGDSQARYRDSKPIIEKQGLAYYIIEKKGEISFEQNPNYRVHPQIATQ